MRHISPHNRNCGRSFSITNTITNTITIAITILVPALLLIGCQQDGHEPLQQIEVEQHFDSPSYGLHTAFWWEVDLVGRDMQAVRDLGFSWVKQHIAWRDIENHNVPGSYDWFRMDNIVQQAENHDINLIIRLDQPPFWALPEDENTAQNGAPADPATFGTFCYVMANRYAGRIPAYQVWNEPNLSREWGDVVPDPVRYVALLKSCYQGIKQADPDAIVISAGLAPTCTWHDGPGAARPDMWYLRTMYETMNLDGGSAGYFDVLGLNAPGYLLPPDADYSGDYTPDAEDCAAYTFRFRHVEDMRDIMLEYGDGHKQIAILEMGWMTNDGDAAAFANHTSYQWFAVDTETQAQYLVDAYRWAQDNWTPWIGPMNTIYISAPRWDAAPETYEQWWWAIMFSDGTKRPAYDALKNLQK